MLKSIAGIYRNGKIELLEAPTNIPDKTQVIVTFLESGSIDLRMCGIDETQAADLRSRLSTFADDWENPEMDVYDAYDAAKAKL